MSKIINNRKRMSELYGFLADGRGLELFNTDGRWLDAAANDDPKKSIGIYIEYRVKPLTYAESLQAAIEALSNENQGNIDEEYESMFNAGMVYVQGRAKDEK